MHFNEDRITSKEVMMQQYQMEPSKRWHPLFDDSASFQWQVIKEGCPFPEIGKLHLQKLNSTRACTFNPLK